MSGLRTPDGILFEGSLIMNLFDKLKADPRVMVRRDETPYTEGRCVVYWMQRAQRGIDNAALDVAIQVADELHKPFAVFFGLPPKYPNANLRHYAFLLEPASPGR
jgi:deoxyribodipyrimidine photo-lyase